MVTGPAYGSWTTARQKSRGRSTKVDTDRDKRDRRKHGQKNHKVWMVPSANTTSLLRCSCAINYPILPPNTAYSLNIQRTSLQYLPFPTLLPPYKDSTPNLSTHIRRKVMVLDVLPVSSTGRSSFKCCRSSVGYVN